MTPDEEDRTILDVQGNYKKFLVTQIIQGSTEEWIMEYLVTTRSHYHESKTQRERRTSLYSVTFT